MLRDNVRRVMLNRWRCLQILSRLYINFKGFFFFIGHVPFTSLHHTFPCHLHLQGTLNFGIKFGTKLSVLLNYKNGARIYGVRHAPFCIFCAAKKKKKKKNPILKFKREILYGGGKPGISLTCGCRHAIKLLMSS